MMDPEKQRLDYGEQLNPPPGYELCSALVTTYSLDLEALTCATLALTLGQTLEGDVSEEKLALLESIDNLKSKLLVFHNASSVHVPPKYNSLYALLEPYLMPVSGSTAFSAFHPKLWLMRFVSLAGDRERFRLLVLSRNLTFDRSWDIAVSLDGVLENRRHKVNDPLIAFLRDLPAQADTALAIQSWCEALEGVAWDVPKPFTDVRFLPGLSTTVPLELEGNFDGLLVVSPFVDADQDGLLHALGARAPKEKKALVSRSDTLNRLGKERLEGWHCYSIPDSIVDGEDQLDDGERRLNDLHAKMVIATKGRSTVWHVGSANMTNAAFGKGNVAPRNTEFMLRLTAPSRLGGPLVLVQQWFDASLIVRHEFANAAPVDTKQEAILRKLVHELTATAWRMTATQATDDMYLVRIDAPSVPSIPVGLQVTVELLCRASEQTLTSKIEWTGVRLGELSAFVTIHVTSTRTQPFTRLQSFVLKTDLVSPVHEARRQAVFRDVVGTPQRLLNYLALLVDPGASKGKWRRGEQGGNGSGIFGFDGGGGLYEQLLRAAARSPARIGRAAEVANRVIGEGIDVPEGLSELLRSFERATQES